MGEHGSPSSDTEVSRHCLANPGHSFNLETPEILGFEQHTVKRRIKEALFIQERKPSLNKQENAYQLFLFGVSNM